MQQRNKQAERLISALPPGDFINKPEEIDRFIVQVWPDGTIRFKGTRSRIEEFLHLCSEEGFDVRVDHISLCG